MESPSIESSKTLLRYLDAREKSEFFGRTEALAVLQSLAADAVRGGVRGYAIDGPSGSGKSELLRQFALAPVYREARLTPLYLDLGSLARGDTAGDQTAGAPWTAIFSAIVRQVLMHSGRMDMNDPLWSDLESGRLIGACFGAGLGYLAPYVRQKDVGAGGAYLWRELLQMLKGALPHPPVLIVDGVRQAGRLDGRGLGELIADALRAGCGVVYEMPASASQRLALPVDDIEVLDLAPLKQEEAVALVRMIALKRGWAISPHLFLPVLPRLGPWPGWVRAWAGMIKPSSEIKPLRVVEKSYVDFIAASAWSRRLRDRYEHLVGHHMHEAALRLALAVLQRKGVVSIEEACAVLDAQPAEAGKILNGLAEMRLIRVRGMKWQAPAEQALVDWMNLTLAEARDALGIEGAQVDLLVRLLAQPHPDISDPDAQEPERLEPARVMRKFKMQLIPYVLLNYGDYYEAVGRLDPRDRREMVGRATSTVHLPEVIGVAGWHSTFGNPGEPRLYYARGFREGKYLSCNEEVWIMADLSAIRTLTTPELERALTAVDTLKKRLGECAFKVWLIIGEGASDEALKAIRLERILCSNLEQVGLLSHMLTPAPPRRPPGVKTDERERDPREAFARRGVIDLASVAGPQAAETSSIRIPAREGSEVIAALMAEKLAIRGGYDAAAAGQIKTSVLEGVLNAIEHSTNAEKFIEVAFSLEDGQFEVTIENEGRPFTSAATPALDPVAKLGRLNKRGWGINLMKRFMDKVEYEPCATGTRLRLIKHRPAKAPTKVHRVEGFGGKSR